MSAVAVSPSSWLERLNPQQQRAVLWGVRREDRFTCEPLLIIAGAGTGKTSTLAHRVAHLFMQGVAPERLLLLTFTRRAAQELIRRAQHIVQDAKRAESQMITPTRLPWAGTFHSVGNRLLRQYAERAGISPSFSVADRGDAADLLDVIRQELGLAQRDKRFPRKDTCLAIYSHRVNTQCPLEQTLKEHFPWCLPWADELQRLFRRYVEVKIDQNVLDYDDLLLYWHALVQEPALARELGDLFDHVLVDEYQDTNTLQAQILRAMKPDGTGVCVVGDDAQAIYSFRAASVENILQFPRSFTRSAEVLALEQNYRSVQPILDASNALIEQGARQYRKQLFSRRSSHQKPRYVSVHDDLAQAEYVISHVLEARGRGIALHRQAVLMRSSHHSDVLEVELTRRNIPYVKYGGLKFLEAAHVKDLLALLRWADNPRHRIAATRVLQLLPGMGPAAAQRCFKVFEAAGFDWQWLATYQVPKLTLDVWPEFAALMPQLAAPDAWPTQAEIARRWYEPHLERLYEAAEARRGDLEQLQLLASQYASRTEFVTELTLEPPQVSSDRAGPPLQDEDYLILSTIHSAKGQEWDSVFVLNVADGNLPSEFATGRPELIEEERRLMYVAMTRARDELHLIRPLKYYITHQPRGGAAHVYGAESRFMTPHVKQHFEVTAWSPPSMAVSQARPGASVDVATKLLDMWK
jgi:DNA helicase-2/ATP-dependent DNA helicase PcrA